MSRFRFVYSFATILLSVILMIYINIGKIKLGLNALEMKNKYNSLEEYKSPTDTSNSVDRIIIRENKPKHLPSPIDPGELDLDIIRENNERLENDTAIELITKYEEKFDDLHSKVENEISKLIQAGVTDYNSGKFSMTGITNKYLSEGTKLEQIFDVEFNSLLSELEKELVKNHYDTSIIKDIEEYYETFKSDKKAQILAKGMDLGQGK